MPTLAAVQSSCAFASPHHLDQALQRELTALATLEADHRSACRWLDEWSGPKAAKERVSCRLEERHRTEREVAPLRLADCTSHDVASHRETRPASARIRSVAALAWVRLSQRSRSYDFRSG